MIIQLSTWTISMDSPCVDKSAYQHTFNFIMYLHMHTLLKPILILVVILWLQ